MRDLIRGLIMIAIMFVIILLARSCYPSQLGIQISHSLERYYEVQKSR